MRQGPMTGGGFGPCGGGAGPRGVGGGYGRGAGFGRGFGRGMGARNRRWAPEWTAQGQDSPPDQTGLLQRLTDELKRLGERIAKLEKAD